MCNNILTLEARKSYTLNQCVDAAYTVHAGMKSYTKLIFTIDKGSIASSSTKQKSNMRSTVESKLNGTDECMSKVTQTKKFLEAENYEIKLNIILKIMRVLLN